MSTQAAISAGPVARMSVSKSPSQGEASDEYHEDQELAEPCLLEAHAGGDHAKEKTQHTIFRHLGGGEEAQCLHVLGPAPHNAQRIVARLVEATLARAAIPMT
jgi:hypothetical protein